MKFSLARTPLLLLAALARLHAAASPAGVAAELRRLELDPAECYRVRDVPLTRGSGDIKLYFNEGFLIFGKPVAGRRISAVFAADVEGGDGEVLVIPPSKGERISLSAFTQTPTMNEHFRAALMLFTDDTAEALAAELKRRDAQRTPDRGLLMAQEWNSVLGNLSGSFSIRLIQQVSGNLPASRGVFYAALQGRRLGNFDVSYDPDAPDQIHIGQIKYKEERGYYDTWTSFPSRPHRGDRAEPLPPGDVSLDNYRIEASLNDALRLKVVTRATVTPRRGPLPVVGFEITDGMNVTAVRIDGAPAQLFTREALRANLLRRNESILFLVTPAQPLEAGRAYEVEFEHEGNVVRHAGRDVYFVSSRSNWYPQSGTLFARYDIRFEYPGHLQIVFPGELKEDRENGSRRVTRRVSTAPLRTAGFNLGKYESVKSTRGMLTVELFANKQVEFALRSPGPGPVIIPPLPSPFPRRGPGVPNQTQQLPPVVMPQLPNPAARLQTMAGEIASGFEFLALFLGPPALPTLMVAPIPGTFGQGFPGLVYLSTLSYLDPRERPAPAREGRLRLFFDEILHAHESAHQWWGNVVSAGPQDDWLLESLANYSALLYIEKHKGAKTVNEILNEYRQRLLRKEGDLEVDQAGPIRLGTRLQNSLVPGAWRDIAYGKGSWVLHMLRKRMGDPAFLKMLGDICRQKRHGVITLREFQEFAVAAMPPKSADRKLEAFFDHWVDNTGIPALEMTTAIKGRAPKVQLTITVKQSAVDASASFAVPVEVQLGRGRTQTHWVTTGEEPAVLTLALPAPPVKVTLDPDESVLKR
ncbi:MAG: M1 family metallopeptidase [Acidobacteria bacterium]|nr:M1 family metallopeptidase [Acidobacteriota bacterium]